MTGNTAPDCHHGGHGPHPGDDTCSCACHGSVGLDTGSTPNGQRDAHVQVLTAEVRTLMVGSRQVTLSVYKQLDYVGSHAIHAFGRMNPDGSAPPFRDEQIWVVGQDPRTGALVKSSLRAMWPRDDSELKPELHDGESTGRFHWYDPDIDRVRIIPVAWKEMRRLAADWQRLPLIVLAGLR
ncbi:MAG: hypothetical protein ACRDOK_01560 [Streptosporangiaceae bacterium]